MLYVGRLQSFVGARALHALPNAQVALRLLLAVLAHGLHELKRWSSSWGGRPATLGSGGSVSSGRSSQARCAGDKSLRRSSCCGGEKVVGAIDHIGHRNTHSFFLLQAAAGGALSSSSQLSTRGRLGQLSIQRLSILEPESKAALSASCAAGGGQRGPRTASRSCRARRGSGSHARSGTGASSA
jgi:hypothetical protein